MVPAARAGMDTNRQERQHRTVDADVAVIGMAGCFPAALADADVFDASFFDFTAEAARSLSPQQRLFLEHSWHALEDAGHDPRRSNGLIGAFTGPDVSSELAAQL